MKAFDALHRCCDERKVDIDTFPDTRFRGNLAWFVDEHNVARPPFGWYLDNRPYEADLRTLLLAARSAALTSLREACKNEGQDPEWLIQAIKERAVDGVIHFSSHDDELAMNAAFAHWFDADAEAHLLVRWLLEAEFLDAYVFKDNDEVSALNEGKRYPDFERAQPPPPAEQTLSDLLLLSFSGQWRAVSNPNKEHHMGPAGRLLTYWIRGEMLGSLPFHTLGSDDAPRADFEVLSTESLRPLANGSNRASRIFKRARLHAVARTEVITHVEQRDGVVERWRLCDTKASRFDHVLSESWSVNDASWSECVTRGLSEELDLTETHQQDLDVVSVGGARFELRESGSMQGLMTLTLVQDFLAEIPEMREDLTVVELVGGQNLPQKRFDIPDSGGAELIWAPALDVDVHPSEAVKPFVEGQPLVGGHFYGVHYGFLPGPSDSDVDLPSDPIVWMLGAAIAIHTSHEPVTGQDFIAEGKGAKERLEQLKKHPVGLFLLDDNKGVGLKTIHGTENTARRGCAKKIRWNGFSKALGRANGNRLHTSLKSFFDAGLLPDWKTLSSEKENERREAKSRLFLALGALCQTLDSPGKGNVLREVAEKQKAIRKATSKALKEEWKADAKRLEENGPHYDAHLLVAVNPSKLDLEGKHWEDCLTKMADLVEYLCSTPTLRLLNSDGDLDVTNLIRGSSGEASATFLIRGDGSVVEDQGRGLDLSVWEEASKSLSSNEEERAAAVEALRMKGAIQRRYR